MPEHYAATALTRAGVQPAAVDFYEGRPSALPGVIRVDYRAIRELRTRLSKLRKESNKDASVTSEILGILLGSFSEYGIHVRSCEVLGNQADFTDLEALAQTVENRIQTAPEQTHFLGFFRTQAGGWPEVTDADREMTKECLNASGAFFLVIQTLTHRPWFATLFTLTDEDLEHSIAVLEFPFDESVLRHGHRPEHPPASIPEPEPPPLKVSWGRKLSVSIVLLAIAGIAATWLYTWHSVNVAEPVETHDAVSRPFDLQVSKAGSEFTISWDVRSAAIQQSKDGNLLIRDGDISKSIDLNPETLRRGRFLYSPVSDNPVFRLQVKDSDGKTYSESVELLRSLPDVSALAASRAANPPPDPSPIDIATERFKSLRSFLPSAAPSAAPAPSRTSRNPAPAANAPAAVSSTPSATPAPVQTAPPVAPNATTGSSAASPPPANAQSARPVQPGPAARPSEEVPPPKAVPVETAAGPGRGAVNSAPAATPPVTPPAAPPSSPPPSQVKPAAALAAAINPAAPPSTPTGSPSTASGTPAPAGGSTAKSAPLTETPARTPEPAKTVPQPVAPAAPKIGGQLHPAELVFYREPVYPAAAKRAHIQGSVVLETKIGDDGKVKSVRVVSGNSWLNGAAVDAVKQRVYKPAFLNGSPIESSIRVVLEFRIP